MSKFSKMFGLDDVAKGLYASRFNTKEDCRHARKIPDLHWFLPEDCKLTSRRGKRIRI